MVNKFSFLLCRRRTGGSAIAYVCHANANVPGDLIAICYHPNPIIWLTTLPVIVTLQHPPAWREGKYIEDVQGWIEDVSGGMKTSGMVLIINLLAAILLSAICNYN
jgi:hypothetical protein